MNRSPTPSAIAPIAGSSASERKRHFDAGYRETIALRDGREITLRLVRPDDKERLKRGFERMSPESRYRRFFAVKKTLTDAELVYLTELDGFNHFAIAATTSTPDGTEEGVGIARFVRSKADARVAEAAVAVLDDWQNKGVGTLLLARLVAAARERGIERFEARALADNLALRDVLAHVGPGIQVRHDADEIVIEAELPDVPSDILADTRSAPYHKLLTLAARGIFAVQRLFSKLEL